MSDYPVASFATKRAWNAWLKRHHDKERGVWIRFSKVHSELKSVSRADALDVALCYGWIDGQAKRYDADTWLQKFTPRGKRSIWSKRNREHVARLIESGEMQPAGLAAVEAAQSDGRWDRAYDAPSTASVPDDFAAALQEYPQALAFFATLKSGQRYSFLHRIQTAVKPDTRARRIAQFIEVLKRHEIL